MESFCKANPDITIEVTPYLTFDQTYQLANQMEAGEFPDIICSSVNYLPFYRLVSRGELADLMPYIQSDEQLRDAISENHLRCMSIDGKLYEASPAFGLGCLDPNFAKAGIVKPTKLSFDELFAMEEKLPEGMTLLDMGLHPCYYLTWMMEHYFDDFVDLETGECDFENQLFYDLLSLSAHSLTYWQQEKAETPLSTNYLIYPGSLYVNYDDNAGVNNRMGFPSEQSGYYMFTYFSAVMTSSCQRKDEAWRFIRQFFTEEYYMEHIASMGFFAVNKNADAKMRNTVKSDSYYASAKAAMASADRAVRPDAILNDIIWLECLPYFSHQITQRQAAENVQKMASAYIGWKWQGQEPDFPPMTFKSVKALCEALCEAKRLNAQKERYLMYQANDAAAMGEFYAPASTFDGFKLSEIQLSAEALTYFYTPKDGGYSGDIVVTFPRNGEPMELGETGVIYDAESRAMYAAAGDTWMKLTVPSELNDYEYLKSHLEIKLTNPYEIVLGGKQY